MPHSPQNVILIGYRGSGKSTIGRMLAERIGWAFVDTDERIARVAGCDVRTLFARDGEAAFRDREQQAVADACGGSQQVIAVGGGAVLREANRDAMRAAGMCVWLTASVAELRARLQADPQSAVARPALTSAGVLDEIASVLQQRTPLYQAVANMTIATDGRTAADVVDDLLGRLPASITRRGAR
ncbi:MAG: shikimate kinase [Phycisphaerae bacterium]